MRASPGPTRRRSATWLFALALASALSAAAAAAAPAVDVKRDGDRYVVHASGHVAADPRVAWDTLTDYEHLDQFVPDIERSRVVSRAGQRLVVEHVGAFRLLFVTMPVRVRLAVQLEPYRSVIARTDPGPVGAEAQSPASVSSSYRLVPLAPPEGGVRVEYDARLRLGDALPAFLDSTLGTPIVEYGLRRQFEAMLNEIERRQAVLTSLENR